MACGNPDPYALYILAACGTFAIGTALYMDKELRALRIWEIGVLWVVASFTAPISVGMAGVAWMHFFHDRKRNAERLELEAETQRWLKDL